MAGVTCKEDTTSPIVCGLAVMQPEMRQPFGVTQAYGASCSAIDNTLQFLN